MEIGLPQRLAVQFREKIERGEWAVGSRLPTTRELARTYQVSINTIQTAFRELEADHLVERRPRIGGFVRARHRRSGFLRTATTMGVVGPYSQEGRVAGEWGYRIMRGLEAELATSGFHLANFSYAVNDADAVSKIVEKIDQAGETLGGCLCFVHETVSGLLEKLDERNVPWVTVNRWKEHAAHNFVTHDAFQAARLIGRCLGRLGYERVTVLSDALGNGRSTGDKYFGFLEGWIEVGMRSSAVDFVHSRTFEEECGHDAFAQHVEKHGVPRAVFCSGDFLALGAIRTCREMGLSVPDQVAVIGSTGLEFAAYSHPALTVLQTPMEQMGASAGQMLLEMAREGVRRMAGRYARAELNVRESCPIPADLLEKEQAAIDGSP